MRQEAGGGRGRTVSHERHHRRPLRAALTQRIEVVTIPVQILLRHETLKHKVAILLVELALGEGEDGGISRCGILGVQEFGRGCGARGGVSG